LLVHAFQMTPDAPRIARAVSVDDIRRIDAEAIEILGIPRLLLMEHAGLALARVASRTAGEHGGMILVCCGPGFNGGDGLAAARHLHAWGHPVRVLMASALGALRGEPAVYLRILQALRVPLLACDTPELHDGAESWITTSGLLIDALLGVGITGTVVREPIRSLILRMNASERPIVAADLPSGLDADTGQVGDVAINAAQTVAFGLAKRGCLSREGAVHTGALTVDSISLPPQLLGAIS